MYKVSSLPCSRVELSTEQRTILLLPLGLLLAMPLPAAHAQQFLPLVGSDGGSGFTAECPVGQHLTGLELRAGASIDAIKPVCVTAFGPTEINAPVLTSESGLVMQGPLIRPVLPPGWYGGTGGQIARVMCPSKKPIVIGFGSTHRLDQKSLVFGSISIYCGMAAPGQVVEPFPQAFHAGLGGGNKLQQACPADQLAIGVHGRHGTMIDALGLICAPPRIDTSRGPAVKPMPRVIGNQLPQNDAARNICDSALVARQRNSPATAGLDAKCAEQTARARANQNAALERTVALRKRAADLAIHGAVIGLKDPVIIDMRARNGTGVNAEPFNVGLAVSQSQTEWGPGKQQLAELYPVGVGLRESFMLAAQFTLDRNRNAERLAIGRPIVDADPELAAARDKVEDARFGIGFDLATAIFGDPALGAQGNTELGPGSLGIRTALSENAKLGFDAAVALHLSRTYK